MRLKSRYLHLIENVAYELVSRFVEALDQDDAAGMCDAAGLLIGMIEDVKDSTLTQDQKVLIAIREQLALYSVPVSALYLSMECVGGDR